MNIDELVLMDPTSIEVRPPFSTILKPNKDVKKRLLESMLASGFDAAHPVHVWKQGNCLIDGHQRRAIAIEAGVQVYVYFHDFESERDALIYAVRNQRDRRNMTDAEQLHLVQIMDKLKPRHRPGPAPGSMTKEERNAPIKDGSQLVDPRMSREVTAELIGISRDKVQKARAVLKRPELKEAVENETISLNKAAEIIRERNREAKAASSPNGHVATKTTKPKKTKQSPRDKLMTDIDRWATECIRLVRQPVLDRQITVVLDLLWRIQQAAKTC
jgi:hypothetical protein